MKLTRIAIYTVLLALAATISFSIGKRSAPPVPARANPAPQAVQPAPDRVVEYPHLEAYVSPQLPHREADTRLSGDITTAAAGYGFIGDRPAPAFLDQLGIEEIPGARDSIESLNEPARSAFLSALVSRWAHFQPADAANYAVKNLAGVEQKNAFSSIASIWGAKDPEAVVAWHATLLVDTEHISHPNQINGILKQVFYQWAKHDLPAAITRATALRADDLNGPFNGIGELARHREFRQPILDSIVEVGSELSQQQTLIPVMKAWEEENLPAAAAWLDEHGITDKYIVKALAERYANLDTLESAKWQVGRTQTPEERQVVIQKIRQGGRRSPPAEEVVHWLDSLAEAPAD